MHRIVLMLQYQKSRRKGLFVEKIKVWVVVGWHGVQIFHFIFDQVANSVINNWHVHISHFFTFRLILDNDFFSFIRFGYWTGCQRRTCWRRFCKSDLYWRWSFGVFSDSRDYRKAWFWPESIIISTAKPWFFTPFGILTQLIWYNIVLWKLIF